MMIMDRPQTVMVVHHRGTASDEEKHPFHPGRRTSIS